MLILHSNEKIANKKMSYFQNYDYINHDVYINIYIYI